MYVGLLAAGIALLNVVSMVSEMKYSERAGRGRMRMILVLQGGRIVQDGSHEEYFYFAKCN